VAKPSILDLGMGGRSALALTYLTIQAALVLTASLRPDGLFAFQMFNESSTIVITLGRRVRTEGGGTSVVATDGSWQAPDRNGVTHAFRWSDRVHDPVLSKLDRHLAAAYGVDAQLFRLQKALDDVTDHLEGDAETLALVADVRIRKNGRDPYDKRLESRERLP
jgi:hypothetical protein